jgi:MFS family permease
MISMQAIQATSSTRFRVACLCAAVLLVEGYDIAAVGYVVPLLVDAWRVPPAAFTSAQAAGNIGLLLGSLIAGLLGDRLGRKPVIIACVSAFGILSLVSAIVASPTQLAMVRVLTGLGLGGGIPLAIALAADFAPAIAKARFVLLASLGIPVGFALAGFVSVRLIGAFGWPAVFIAGGAAPLFLAPVLMLCSIFSRPTSFCCGPPPSCMTREQARRPQLSQPQSFRLALSCLRPSWPRLSTASGSSEFSPSRSPSAHRASWRSDCSIRRSLYWSRSFSAPGSASARRAASMRFPA